MSGPRDEEPKERPPDTDAGAPSGVGSTPISQAPPDGEPSQDDDVHVPEPDADTEAEHADDAAPPAAKSQPPTPSTQRPPTHNLQAETEEDVPPDAFDTQGRRSSRLHKQQVAAFATLAKDLVELGDPRRAKLGLAPELEAAVRGCVSLRKGARMRELRRIATMLRQFDGAGLRARVDDITNKDRASVERTKSYERWRERLLEEGDAALSDLVQAFPRADRQHLRQLIRTASRDRSQGKSRQAFRNLLREVRALDSLEDE